MSQNIVTILEDLPHHLSATKVAQHLQGDDPVEQMKYQVPKFKAVMDQIKIDGIISLATYMRRAKDVLQNPATTDPPIPCKVIQPPMNGSYNVVYRIDFNDGARWVLKVPANGHKDRWDALAAQGLGSEAQTMRLIKGESSVPVPTVHSFSSSMDNEVGCPYILMDCVPGRSLYHAWFDKNTSNYRREQVRARALQTVAAAMAQLYQFRADQGGSFQFDSQGTPISVGGAKTVDTVSLYDRYNDDGGLSKDYEDVFYEKGPTADPTSSLLYLLERSKIKRKDNTNNQGVDKSIRLFTKWILERIDCTEKPFALAHPDFDLQNIYVEEDGTLCGIIDWDGVAAEPLLVGCLRYPNWLIRDWDPTFYNMDTETEEPLNPSGRLENTPTELFNYRVIYAQFIESALSSNPLSLGHSKDLACITRFSVVTKSLEMAANVPFMCEHSMSNIFDEVLDVAKEKQDGDDEVDLEAGNLSLVDSDDSSDEDEEDEDEEDDEDDEGEGEGEDEDGAGTPPLQVRRTVEEAQCRRCLAEKAATLVAQHPVETILPRTKEPMALSSELNQQTALSSTEPDSCKVKVAKLALGFGEMGLRGLAKTFYRKNEFVAGTAQAGMVDENQGSNDFDGIRYKGDSKADVLLAKKKYLRTELRGIVAGIPAFVEKVLHLNDENQIMPDYTAQMTKTSQQQEILEQEAPGPVAHVDMGLEHSPDCPKAPGYAVPARDNVAKEIPSGLTTNDIWDRIARHTKDCGITKAMLKDGQQEITEWIIVNLKEKARRKRELEEQAKEEARTFKRNAARAARKAKKAEEVAIADQAKKLHTPQQMNVKDDVAVKEPGNGIEQSEHSKEESAREDISKLDPSIIALKLLTLDNVIQGTAKRDHHRLLSTGDYVHRSADIDEPAIKNEDSGRAMPVSARGACIDVGSDMQAKPVANQDLTKPAIPAKPVYAADGKLIARNKHCPCGSSRKFKKCCYKAEVSPQTKGEAPSPTEIAEDHQDVIDDSGRTSPGTESASSSHGKKSSKTSLDSVGNVPGHPLTIFDAISSKNHEQHETDHSLPILDKVCHLNEAMAVEDTKAGFGELEKADTDVAKVTANDDKTKEAEENLDHGGFTMREICFALGNGTLDKKRYDRLHKCFNLLLDWTMGLW